MSGQYPHDFRADDWIYGPQGHWWHPLVGHILGVCRNSLQRTGLYEAVMVIQVGFCQSYGDFVGIFDFYDPDSGTFFTPIGELEVAYHEIHYVSGLPYRKFLYEERFPTNGELEQWAQMPEVVKTYWEVPCHFNIRMDLSDRRKGGPPFTKWVKYLISDLKRPKTLRPVSLAEVEARITAMDAENANEKESANRPICLRTLKAALVRALHSRVITI